MNIDINSLKEKSLLPVDCEVISDQNNVIVRSESERFIARIALLSEIKKRTTPGDLMYSHGLAWDMRDYDVTVAPVSAVPTQDGDVIISSYPLMQPLEWQRITADSVYEKVSKMAQLGSTLSSEMTRQLYTLDISEYAQRRLEQVRENDMDDETAQLADIVERQVGMYVQRYPFSELRDSDPALVHGDLHTGNIVVDNDNPLLIDLDSVSLGPRLYDLASWHVRSLRGENVPTTEMIKVEKSVGTWNQETFDALMGWKVISSLTHILRYETAAERRSSITNLAQVAIRANIPQMAIGR